MDIVVLRGRAAAAKFRIQDLLSFVILTMGNHKMINFPAPKNGPVSILTTILRKSSVLLIPVTAGAGPDHRPAP